MDTLIKLGLIVLLTAGFIRGLKWFLTPPEAEPGSRKLYFGLRHKLLCTSIILFGLIFVYALRYSLDTADTVAALLLFGFFTSMGAYYLALSISFSAHYDDKELVVNRFWQKPRRFLWENMKAITHSNTWNIFRFEFHGGEKTSMSVFLAGLTGFLELAEAKANEHKADIQL